MSEQKPTRSVKKTWAEAPVAPAAPDPVIYEPVIRGVVDLDVRATHQLLTSELRSGADGMTGSILIGALDVVQDRLMQASRLKNRARREYEFHKEIFSEWMEEKKAAALKVLGDKKDAGEIKKQITIDMVEDFVRVNWSDDYRRRKREMADFAAAVHTLEDLHEAWRGRARTLGDLKDLVITYRPPERR